jgi:uncharacterized membrane protein YccC
MTSTSQWAAVKQLLVTEWQHLTTINASDRKWQMPLAAALSTGLPLLIGAYFDHLQYGLVSSLGGLVYLYLPNTPLSHRMVVLIACAFGMTACYTLGLMSSFFPWLMTPVLVFIAVLVTMLCRFYNLGPPGSLMFVTSAAIGAYTPPIEVLQLPLMVGLVTMGCLLATLVAFFYSVAVLRTRAPETVLPLPAPTFDFVVFDSIVIGVFVGISMALAQALQLQKAYWVPISCLAVIQGVSLRAVWNRQLQRIIGTGIGLLLSWSLLLLLPLNKWSMPLTMMALTFMIEVAVVRHYAFAAIFITPLTLLLAEAATLGHTSPSELIHARFFDTVLGCLVGLAGGICLHSPRFREVLGGPLQHLIPSRFLATRATSK